MPVRILIYDDNEALRQSMETLIREEEAFQLIAAMSNAETVETDVRELKPDVVLMDIDMPAVDGVAAVKRIRKVDGVLPVIMLTVFDDNENIFNAVCAGASGYILKRCATEELGAAIRNVISGGAPMTGVVARKVLQMVPAAKGTSAEERAELSQREVQILQLLARGFSYKMIAAEVGVSVDTVRFHIKNIYDKLHVHSATEAVSKGLRGKFISLLF
ncbi:MAG TPA: response regulator transcription factor [Puia sp.]|uniref:response regulator transcription factor n=1 Tax=Puia sp. TaxID=2045100 RepID=UPI002BFBB97D|nr:response regulator transcription factor [Puia sp.]HVU98395.1 response regulator transcription factor [Puia sp.]